MKTPLIRFHKQILALLVPLILFQNCLVQISADVPGRPTPADVTDIQYSVSGGFPGPNGPLFTFLSLKTLANDQISADLKTESCTARGLATRAEFDRVILGSVDMAEFLGLLPADSLTTASTSYCADCPRTSLKFSYRNGLTREMLPQLEAQKQITTIIDRLRATCTSPILAISKLRYFRGGWYGMAPNWAHDYAITMNPDGSANVNGKHPDRLCLRSGSLDRGQIKTLASLVTGLQLEVSNGPQGADAGIEIIEVQYSTGESRTIHLMRFEAPAKSLYATNPTALSNFLNNVGNNLATGCQ